MKRRQDAAATHLAHACSTVKRKPAVGSLSTAASHKALATAAAMVAQVSVRSALGRMV